MVSVTSSSRHTRAFKRIFIACATLILVSALVFDILFPDLRDAENPIDPSAPPVALLMASVDMNVPDTHWLCAYRFEIPSLKYAMIDSAFPAHPPKLATLPVIILLRDQDHFELPDQDSFTFLLKLRIRGFEHFPPKRFTVSHKMLALGRHPVTVLLHYAHTDFFALKPEECDIQATISLE